LDEIKGLYFNILLNVMKFHEILLSFDKSQKYHVALEKDQKILLNLAKLSANVFVKYLLVGRRMGVAHASDFLLWNFQAVG
jgi:hypothetical protein